MSDLRILLPVFDDITEATDWYDELLPGLGNRFIESFYTALSEVQKNPFVYRPVYREFRRVLLKPFPYATYYRLQDDTVIVTLVFHSARNPRSLQRTLRKR